MPRSSDCPRWLHTISADPAHACVMPPEVSWSRSSFCSDTSRYRAVSRMQAALEGSGQRPDWHRTASLRKTSVWIIGRFVDITGPICARRDNSHVLLGLEPSGQHDWPVMSTSRKLTSTPLEQSSKGRVARNMSTGGSLGLFPTRPFRGSYPS